MKNRYFIVFANDCSENIYCVEAYSEQEAIAFVYDNYDEVHVMGINNCFCFKEGVFPIENKDDILFAPFKWNKSKGFEIARVEFPIEFHTQTTYLCAYYTPLKICMEYTWINHGISLDDNRTNRVAILPVLIDANKHVIHLETGLSTGFSESDFLI